MDEIISYKMCAVKVRNAKLRNYLKYILTRRAIGQNVDVLLVFFDGRVALNLLIIRLSILHT